MEAVQCRCDTHCLVVLQAWQVLPLVPPERGFWSPYSGLDALCGNTLLIALDELVEDGLIDKADLPKPQPVADADFPKASNATIEAWTHVSNTCDGHSIIAQWAHAGRLSSASAPARTDLMRIRDSCWVWDAGC